MTLSSALCKRQSAVLPSLGAVCDGKANTQRGTTAHKSAPTALLTTSHSALKLLAIFGRCGSAVERLIWCDRLVVIKKTLHFLEYRILRFEEVSYGTTREQNIIALHASRYYKKGLK